MIPNCTIISSLVPVNSGLPEMYGYRKVGDRGQGRLVISEQPIPGFELSEAEVIRTIFRMCAIERKSCQKIADHLSRLGIPCSSAAVADPEKRSRRTAPVWRPSHVRNMTANSTYMGQHVFGKRSKNPNRKKIAREVPAICFGGNLAGRPGSTPSNRINSRRNTREPYLLRGLTFSGMRGRPPQRDYDHCNGRQFARGLYGNLGKKCPAKSLNGDYVDRLVWMHIDAFPRNPVEILDKLRERFSMQDADRQRREKSLRASEPSLRRRRWSASGCWASSGEVGSTKPRWTST